MVTFGAAKAAEIVGNSNNIKRVDKLKLQLNVVECWSFASVYFVDGHATVDERKLHLTWTTTTLPDELWMNWKSCSMHFWFHKTFMSFGDLLPAYRWHGGLEVVFEWNCPFSFRCFKTLLNMSAQVYGERERERVRVIQFNCLSLLWFE